MTDEEVRKRYLEESAHYACKHASLSSIFMDPPDRSKLVIGSGMKTVQFFFTCRRPNCWRRFWYWALLGWRWEEVKVKETPD